MTFLLIFTSVSFNYLTWSPSPSALGWGRCVWGSGPGAAPCLLRSSEPHAWLSLPASPGKRMVRCQRHCPRAWHLLRATTKSQRTRFASSGGAGGTPRLLPLPERDGEGGTGSASQGHTGWDGKQSKKQRGVSQNAVPAPFFPLPCCRGGRWAPRVTGDLADTVEPAKGKRGKESREE